MANSHNTFQEFHQNIRILSSKREKMKKAKEILRDKIIKFFKENHPEYEPKFYIQGSHKMRNGIRYKDDTADLDYGVYFLRKPDVTGTTLQKWVFDAVEGHTDGGQQHRKKCIRVIYKDGYHIDLPVFYKGESDLHPFLAVKNEDWQEDDPKELIEWFEGKKDEDGQLLRTIKYLKAWGDHKGHSMPSGLCITLLAARNIVYDTRDDISLKKTLENIEVSVDLLWQCFMPTTPKDDLFAKYDATLEKNFKESLKNFIQDAKDALDTVDLKKARNLWAKHLGDRYPEYKEEESKASSTKSATALGAVASASKPYSK